MNCSDSGLFMRRLRTRLLRNRAEAILLIGWVLGGMAQAEEFSQHIDGDIGLGAFYTSRIVSSKASQVSVLPYAYFSYDRAFIRLDTLGVKMWKLGYGYLEVVGRYSQDGFDADTSVLAGLTNRQTSIPLGVGTMQITPVGAFFINAFHDVNKSGGNLLEAIYVGKVGPSSVALYPFFGAEYRSGKYVNYYYGISPQEAANSQYAYYRPGGAFIPLAGLAVDVGLTEQYRINFYLRRRWLSSSIQDSPIIDQKFLDTGYVALSYRFN